MRARPTPRRPRTPQRRPLGEILLARGALDPGDLVRALALQAREDTRLGDILLAHGMVGETQLMDALCAQYDTRAADPVTDPPDPRLIDAAGPARCLRSACLPWRRLGAATLVATARPEAFEAERAWLEAIFGPVTMMLITRTALHEAVMVTRKRALERRARHLVAAPESCRGWRGSGAGRAALAGALAALGLGLLAPRALFIVFLVWALVALTTGTLLKLAAALAMLRHGADNADPPAAPDAPAIARLPVVSIMVPLLRERDIAPRLIRRLGALSYPRELLDVMLVIEEDDDTTRAALEAAELPRWMRVVQVPHNPLRTKPRALNFAMTFARGSIIGIYDAEDAPDPDQIHRVVRRFYARGAELACVQGVLDYYNPDTNWLARCFTIEYAAWFRILLPGLARLGLVVPLGGTTLFFRRAAVETLGGWDAHNVTEDADLGLRLARHGYRTELLRTVTREEANCRVIPWIKQRSRWLKGYAMTYAVHMRAPRLLWRQLGWRRFAGVQILFLGTLSQFVLAPVLWSFWLVLVGLWHPLAAVLPTGGFIALGALFFLSEMLNIAVNMAAVSGHRHRFLMPWVPTLHFYFPLAALAAYKGLWELVARPFYWDKTAHGLFDQTARARRTARRRPAG
ncbi:glycosyl transferase [Rhodobacteraceae bacterium WD3A24]|nr:glycosyl transferase [Rhodobacteraceae bacterium WD3A24]